MNAIQTQRQVWHRECYERFVAGTPPDPITYCPYCLGSFTDSAEQTLMSKGNRRWHVKCWGKRKADVARAAQLKLMRADTKECPGCHTEVEEKSGWHLTKGGTWWCPRCWDTAVPSGRFHISTVPMDGNIRTDTAATWEPTAATWEPNAPWEHYWPPPPPQPQQPSHGLGSNPKFMLPQSKAPPLKMQPQQPDHPPPGLHPEKKRPLSESPWRAHPTPPPPPPRGNTLGATSKAKGPPPIIPPESDAAQPSPFFPQPLMWQT